jgi:transposase
MKTYSLDFRQKILDVYHNEPLSQRAIANRFGVALSFVQKLIKQYRETQNIAPRTERCGVKLKLNAEQLLILAELIEVNNDATLEELRYLLYKKRFFLTYYAKLTIKMRSKQASIFVIIEIPKTIRRTFY